MIETAYVAFSLAFAVMVLAGRSWRFRWHSAALAAGVMATILAGWFVMNAGLSRPFPAERAIFQDPERAGELLWFGELPPEVFHLLIRWPNAAEPRFYTIPWSDALAAQLEQARRGLNEGENIGVSPFLFDGYDIDGADDPGVFHPLPQMADPLKESPVQGQTQQDS